MTDIMDMNLVYSSGAAEKPHKFLSILTAVTGKGVQ